MCAVGGEGCLGLGSPSPIAWFAFDLGVRQVLPTSFLRFSQGMGVTGGCPFGFEGHVLGSRKHNPVGVFGDKPLLLFVKV